MGERGGDRGGGAAGKKRGKRKGGRKGGKRQYGEDEGREWKANQICAEFDNQRKRERERGGVEGERGRKEREIKRDSYM